MLLRKAQKFCSICTMAGRVIRVWCDLLPRFEALQAYLVLLSSGHHSLHAVKWAAQ